MQMVLAVATLIASLVLIVSVVLQDGNDSGMSSTFGGSDERLFGKGSARGFQATLKRITVCSGVVFMVVVFVMGALFR